MKNSEPLDIARVIAPTDFSEAARPGVQAAHTRARAWGVPMVIVHVWDHEGLRGDIPPLPGIRGQFEQYLGSLEAAQKGKLNAHAREFGEGVEGVLLNDRSAPRAIAQYAEPNDLIVVATHGRTGVGRVLLGSVAEKIVRLAPCPVLTVPSDPSKTNS